MKKLFISCPMKGRTEEAIKKSMEAMHKYAELMMGEELEVIDSYINDNPPKDSKEAIWFLGESIKKMADADVFVGIEYPDDIWGGCRVEDEVAGCYNIKRLYVMWRDAQIFADCEKIIRSKWEENMNKAEIVKL